MFFTYNVERFCTHEDHLLSLVFPLPTCYFFLRGFPIFSQGSAETDPLHPSLHSYLLWGHSVVRIWCTRRLPYGEKLECDTALQADLHCILRHRFGKSLEVFPAFVALIGGIVGGGGCAADDPQVGSANCVPFGAPDARQRRAHQMHRPHN